MAGCIFVAHWSPRIGITFPIFVTGGDLQLAISLRRFSIAVPHRYDASVFQPTGGDAGTYDPSRAGRSSSANNVYARGPVPSVRVFSRMAPDFSSAGRLVTHHQSGYPS